MRITDQELDRKAITLSKAIQVKGIELINVLSEVDRRKSYAEHSYRSLFMYIVRFLGFSESQAAIYNKLVKTKILTNSNVKEMALCGEVSLGVLSLAGQHVRENPDVYKTPKKVEKFVESLRGKTRTEVDIQLNPQKPKSVIKVQEKTYIDLQRVKRKLKLEEMNDNDVIAYLVNKELAEGKTIKNNRTITSKTKAVLLRRAKHRCEFIKNGKRCRATNYLEVDHIIPRSKGGSNHLANLRVLCRAHNQRFWIIETIKDLNTG